MCQMALVYRSSGRNNNQLQTGRDPSGRLPKIRCTPRAWAIPSVRKSHPNHTARSSQPPSKMPIAISTTPSSVNRCRWLIVQVLCPPPEVFRQHLGKGFRRPADQVGDLSVTHLDDPKLAIGSLHNVHRIESAAETLGTFGNNWWHVTRCNVSHAVHNEIAALRVGQKVLHSPDTETTLDYAPEP